MTFSPIRWTKQLKVIVDIVYTSETPVTADQIFIEARKKIPSISLATVYRNLNRLVAEGLVSETKKGNSAVFYRHPFSNTTFECEVCGRIICLPFEMKNMDLQKSTGLRVKRWSLRLVGICRECENKCT
ncbi:MAG: transcriptional repressor [Methanomassiliicoccales archaeon]